MGTKALLLLNAQAAQMLHSPNRHTTAHSKEKTTDQRDKKLLAAFIYRRPQLFQQLISISFLTPSSLEEWVRPFIL